MLGGLLVRPKDERTVDDMFAAAAAVGGLNNNERQNGLQNEVGIFAATSRVRFVDVLSHEDVCAFRPHDVVEMRTALPPGVKIGDRARAMDMIPAGDNYKLCVEAPPPVEEMPPKVLWGGRGVNRETRNPAPLTVDACWCPLQTADPAIMCVLLLIVITIK